MAKETFHATISMEPSTGAVRGKLPGRMVAAMGADPGDVIEFTLSGKKLIEGRVLSSREARDYKAESGRGGSSKSTAKAKVGKKKAKDSGSKGKKKAAKANKRKTRVEYDDEPRTKKKGKLKLKKKGKK